MSFPATAAGLLEHIEKLVPERVPSATDTMEEIQRYAGKRELVLQLIRLREQGDKTPAAAPRSPRRR
ncbi:hypothetical protein [Sphingomonas sp.]|uniref:hypothetical protein n=1 Tax=Sphingomonas sp. TaxID=28214 RepID=UPI002EDA8EC9